MAFLSKFCDAFQTLQVRSGPYSSRGHVFVIRIPFNIFMHLWCDSSEKTKFYQVHLVSKIDCQCSSKLVFLWREWTVVWFEGVGYDCVQNQYRFHVAVEFNRPLFSLSPRKKNRLTALLRTAMLMHMQTRVDGVHRVALGSEYSCICWPGWKKRGGGSCRSNWSSSSQELLMTTGPRSQLIHAVRTEGIFSRHCQTFKLEVYI